MAAGNQVTLTFAGDSTELTSAFDKVGAASKEMADDVGKASREVGSGFDKVNDGVDTTGGKAGDLESGFRGITDSMSGFAAIAEGDVLGGLTDLAGGAEALATGFTGVLLPAIKNMSRQMVTNAVSTARATVASGAHRAASVVQASATWTVTTAQKAMNAAMRANPIGIVITALVLLGAGLVVAYKKSETFRDIVDGAMKGVRTAFQLVLEKGGDLFGWFKDLPGKIGGAFGTLSSAISSPFSTAFGAIRSLWNSTAGGFGFTIPDWVPKIGGNSFTIPKMHTGGIVGGAPGSEQLRILMAGERVLPVGESVGSTVLEIRSGGSRLDDLLVELLRGAIRRQGGDVQVVLGRS